MPVAMFNPCSPCCVVRECPPIPAGTSGPPLAATEKIGNGYVVALGDGNFVVTCGTGTPLDNTPFWLNLAALAGGGPFGCSGNTDDWARLQGSVAPTVGNVFDAAGLVGLKGFWGGHTGRFEQCSPVPPHSQSIPSTLYAPLAAWISQGGVLVLVGEFDTCNSPIDDSNNACLAGVGSSVRFVKTRVDCGCGPDLKGWPGIVNPAHPLINGEIGGHVVRCLCHACSAVVTGGVWLVNGNYPEG